MKTALRALTMMSAVSVMLLLGNCSKDKDPVPADLIIGNWHFSTVNVSVKVGTQSLKDYLIDQGLTEEEAQEIVDDFETDFVGTDTSIDIKKGGTYSATSDGSTDTGTWELSSDGKTFTTDKGTADESVFTITTLTTSSLKMTADESESDGGETLTIHIELSLTK